MCISLASSCCLFARRLQLRTPLADNHGCQRTHHRSVPGGVKTLFLKREPITPSSPLTHPSMFSGDIVSILQRAGSSITIRFCVPSSGQMANSGHGPQRRVSAMDVPARRLFARVNACSWLAAVPQPQLGSATTMTRSLQGWAPMEDSRLGS